MKWLHLAQEGPIQGQYYLLSDDPIPIGKIVDLVFLQDLGDYYEFLGDVAARLHYYLLLYKYELILFVTAIPSEEKIFCGRRTGETITLCSVCCAAPQST